LAIISAPDSIKLTPTAGNYVAMEATNEKLSVIEKIGYGLGEMPTGVIFYIILVFQTFFYTNVFGLTPAEAGTLLLVARVADALFDPIMGTLADRTATRWGKFRPWILWTAVPFGVLSFMVFVTPDFDHTGRLIYAYVTYIVFMTVYSANNVPYSTLSGVMTGDMGERTSISSYRFVFAMLAGIAAKGLAPAMVQFFGRVYDANGQLAIDPESGYAVINYAQGYQWTVGVFSTLCIVFFGITFITTKERIQPQPSQRLSIRSNLVDLLRNGPWKAMFWLMIFAFTMLAMRSSAMMYYFIYYLRKPDSFALFLVLSQAANILGILLAKPLSTRFGKRNTFIGSLLLTALIYLGFFVLSPGDIIAIFVVEMISAVTYGIKIPLTWAMTADVADYSEWKTGRSAIGVVFATMIFSLKAGLGIGGAITGWLLAAYGYNNDFAEQSEQTLQGIRLMVSIYPAIPLLIGAVCLLFYAITKQLNIQMAEELAQRRKLAALYAH
jgi:glycoside/pentoside/hexuronide:cation symporter, GPH family